MKSPKRDPEKFVPLELADALATKHKISLDEVGKFFSLGDYLGRAKADGRLLYGRRVEKMFKYVVSSLGQAKFLESTDSGDVMFDGEPVQAPDYFLRLHSGEAFYVEVKNCRMKSLQSRVPLKADYVQRLQRYCANHGHPLLLAIYWAGLGQWTLNRIEDMLGAAAGVSVTFQAAMERNLSAKLGDRLLGTISPLSCTVYTDPEKERSVKDGIASFTIKAVEFRANGKLITDDHEKALANYLMLYSRWRKADENVVVAGDVVERIDFELRPAPEQVPDSEQPFVMLGTLAGMVSAAFDAATVEQGRVMRLTPLIEPAQLGCTVDDGYRGDVLQLWILIMRPKGSN